MFSKKIAMVGAILAGLLGGLTAAAAPKRYLVKLKSAEAFHSMSQNFAPLNASVTTTFNNVEMMVVESDDALAIQALKNHPGVALVEAEFFHPAPEPIATRSAGDMQLMKRKKKPKDPPVSPEPPKVSSSNMPWGITAVKAPEAWKVTRGNGARVVVLDTGLDLAHPAVASRLEKAKNFTGGDEDDVTDEVGHGTHVAGTILADGANGGLIGVAPEAKLLAGKVCSEQGCSNISIVMGLDWATKEKAEVVNMSLGGAMMSSAEAQALKSAEAAGVMVVAASGNDGKPMVSFPAAAPTALAVGAVDEKLVKADFSNWGPQLAIVAPGVDVISSVPRGTGRGSEFQLDLDGKGLSDIKSLPMVGSPVAPASANELVFANLGKLADFAAINVKGKFALISRGEIPFKEKVANAINAGATGVIVYNNVPGLMQGTVSADGSEVAIPVIMIEQAVGQNAKAILNGGQSLRGSLAVVRTDYASFQGTSMATPHVAGVAALVRAANRNLTPEQVRNVLKSTATPMTPNDENQLGSGMVNAEAAVLKATTPILPDLAIAN